MRDAPLTESLQQELDALKGDWHKLVAAVTTISEIHNEIVLTHDPIGENGFSTYATKLEECLGILQPGLEYAGSKIQVLTEIRDYLTMPDQEIVSDFVDRLNEGSAVLEHATVLIKTLRHDYLTSEDNYQKTLSQIKKAQEATQEAVDLYEDAQKARSMAEAKVDDAEKKRDEAMKDRDHAFESKATEARSLREIIEKEGRRNKELESQVEQATLDKDNAYRVRDEAFGERERAYEERDNAIELESKASAAYHRLNDLHGEKLKLLARYEAVTEESSPEHYLRAMSEHEMITQRVEYLQTELEKAHKFNAIHQMNAEQSKQALDLLYPKIQELRKVIGDE